MSNLLFMRPNEKKKKPTKCHSQVSSTVAFILLQRVISKCTNNKWEHLHSVSRKNVCEEFAVMLN